MPTKIDPKKRDAEAQKLRLLVATAESKMKLLRDKAREAKRRRKEARRIARLARKQFKAAKAELADLRQALANVKPKPVPVVGRVPARRTAKSSPVAKPRVRPSKQAKTIAPRLRSAPPPKSGVSAKVEKKKPVLPATNAVAAVAPVVTTPEPTSSIAETSTPDSLNYE
ncbi:MAG TPA: hypothetical protein PLX89_10020 [Verrucomicrobiota bacterium]|nr:hypothetical protein [Verrucomicrobiales bacterium]HRI13332.1 hypothetical protein [Verrucomicrobiota bacterium]